MQAPPVLVKLFQIQETSEAADFFGPLARLIVEGERPEMAIEFSLTSRGTKQEELVLV